jgi:hypothetical protein
MDLSTALFVFRVSERCTVCTVKVLNKPTKKVCYCHVVHVALSTHRRVKVPVGSRLTTLRPPPPAFFFLGVFHHSVFEGSPERPCSARTWKCRRMHDDSSSGCIWCGLAWRLLRRRNPARRSTEHSVEPIPTHCVSDADATRTRATRHHTRATFTHIRHDTGLRLRHVLELKASRVRPISISCKVIIVYQKPRGYPRTKVPHSKPPSNDRQPGPSESEAPKQLPDSAQYEWPQ